MGGPRRLWRMLGEATLTLHGMCKSTVLSSPRSPLHSQNRNCAPDGPTPQSSMGHISGPESPWACVPMQQQLWEVPESSVLFAQALGSWAMGVPVDSKYHSGSQGHVSEVMGPRTMGDEGIDCGHNPPCTEPAHLPILSRVSLQSTAWIPGHG